MNYLNINFLSICKRGNKTNINLSIEILYFLFFHEPSTHLRNNNLLLPIENINHISSIVQVLMI